MGNEASQDVERTVSLVGMYNGRYNVHKIFVHSGTVA